jgi:WD40 repeat protein
VTENRLGTDRFEDALPSPYKGLSFYSERDAPFFFGREEETSIIAANLVASRLTLVYGASGVGKSSLLRAGVASRLRELAAETVETSGKPGFVVVVFPADGDDGSDRRASWRDDPLGALAAGIEKAVADLGVEVEPVDGSLRFAELLEAWSDRLDGDILLILDQFEEYFLYHANEDGEGTLFEELPRALNRGTLRANVLISIREDAYAQLDRFKGRVSFLYDNYLRVDHLDREAARAAIERPIEERNRLVAASERVEIEPELVEAVLDDVQTGNVVLGQSGLGAVEQGEARDARIETPFLQLVLERLWAEELDAGSRVLRFETLERLGGAERIVRTHLDAAMDELTEEDKELAAGAFRQLVTPSGAKIAHLGSDLAALENAPPEPLARVLETLATARLLRPVAPPPGETEPRYEIFHDVLGPAVLDWRARYVRAQEQEKLEEAQRRARAERRRARLFGALALTALMALVAVALVGAFAWNQKRAAETERRGAESRAFAVEARGLLGGRLDDALSRTLEARDRADTVEARSALLTAVQQTNGLVRFLRYPRPVQAVAAGPGGTFAVALEDGTLVLLDRSGQRIGGRESEEQTIDSIAFDPRTGLLAAGLGRTVKLFELKRSADGRVRLVERLSVGVDQETVRSVAFSPDGRWFAAGGEGGLTLWELDLSGRPQAVPLDGSRGRVTAVAFGGSGRPLLAATSTSGLRLWDLRHPLQEPRLVKPAAAQALALAPDGTLVAAAGRGLVWLGRPLLPLRRLRTGAPTALAFDRKGALLALGDADGSVSLWDVARAQMLGEPLRGQGDRIVSLAFDPDGPILAVASADGTVALWDTNARSQFGSDVDLVPGGLREAATGRKGVVALLTRRGVLESRGVEAASQGHVADRGIEQLAASADGRWLVVRTGDRVAAGELKAKTALRTLSPLVSAKDISVASNGLVAAVDWLNTSVLRWDAAGRQLPTLRPPAMPADAPQSAAISADGRSVAAGYFGGSVVLWRGPGRTPAGVVLGGRGSPVTDLVFDPQGAVLASGDRSGMIELWRVEKGGPPIRLEGHTGEIRSLAFSPDGRMLASSSNDGTVLLWDSREGRLLGDPLRFGVPITAVAFSPDGASLLAVHGALTVWDTSLWQPEDETLERIRGRFCAIVASEAPRSSTDPCRRRR